MPERLKIKKQLQIKKPLEAFSDGDHSGLSQPAMAHRGDCLKCRLCLVWCVGRTLHGYMVQMAHPTWRAMPALLYCKTAGMICISGLGGVGPSKKAKFC